MARIYSDYFSWDTYLDDYCMAHSNGRVSLMFEWKGIDNSLFSESEHLEEIKHRLDLLKSYGHSLVIEHHFFREIDDVVIDAYLKQSKKVIRGHDLAIPIREAMAGHIRGKVRKNSVYVVLSVSAEQTAKFSLKRINVSGVKRRLNKLTALKKRLHGIYRGLEGFYPGARLLSIDEYCQRIIQSTNRQLFYGHDFIPDYRFDLAEQLVQEKPVLTENGVLKIGNHYTKVVLIQNYPNLDPAWFLNLSSGETSIHVSQILIPKDLSKALDKSADEADTTEQTMGKKGVDAAVSTIKDANNYRGYIRENGLTVMDNVFIVHIHDESEQVVINEFDKLEKWINREGGLARGNADIQSHFFRVAAPGLGSDTQFIREDHSLTIAAMLPFSSFDSGNIKDPDSIRMTSSYTAVGFSPTKLTVGHQIVVGATGGGKGTELGTEIAETFPLGMDTYICEFGDTQKWLVEGFGGSYTRVDPDKISINPLPQYSYFKQGKLASNIVSGTNEGLGLLMLEEDRSLNNAEQVIADRVLLSLYVDAKPSATKQAPLLTDYLEVLKTIEVDNDSQKMARSSMYENLFNFLKTSVGQGFCRQDNLNLSPGITGVDLMGVPKNLLIFYMTFVSIRFAQMAFASPSKLVKIWLDELHEPMDVAPEPTRRLVRIVNRMGRKEGGFIGLSTQGIKEIELIDPETITSSPVHTLMARADQWDEIKRKLSIPDAAAEVWKAYSRDFDNMNYRSCLKRMNGRYYDLYLSFPKLCLDITTTTRTDRGIRHEVEDIESDIFKRIELMNEKRSLL